MCSYVWISFNNQERQFLSGLLSVNSRGKYNYIALFYIHNMPINKKIFEMQWIFNSEMVSNQQKQ